jgi:hypothetical protein
MAEHDRLTELRLRDEAGLLSEQEHDELVRLLLEDAEGFEAYFADLQLEAGLAWTLSGAQQSLDYYDQEMVGDTADAENPGPDPSVWELVVDQALADRRKHDIEDQSAARLLAQQAQAERAQRYHLRRMAQGHTPRQSLTLPKAGYWIGLAAVLGIAAVLITQFTPSATPTNNPHTVAQPPETAPRLDATPAPVLATVVRTLDARWADDDARWDGPAGLRRGRHVLTGGLVELEMADGARVVFEGPATFDLTGSNSVTLAHGRLVAHVPPSGIGFTVDTLTARVSDFGTEFAVYADGGMRTEVQVYDGEVRAVARVDGVLVGEAVRLSSREAAQISASAGRVERVAFEPVAFERRVVSRLDVLDIVAGGDGWGSRRNSGVDPATGERVRVFDHPVSQPAVDRPRYRSVRDSSIIDGVFVAAGPTHLDMINSTGHRPSFLRATDRRYLGPIWAMPMSEVGSGNEYTQWAGAIERPELFSPRGHGLLVMHSNAGITFDLQAATRGSGLTATRFTATAANAETHGGTNPTAAAGTPEHLIACSLYVVVDGEVRYRREGFNSTDGVFEIDIDLAAGDRYLTLVVSDGNAHYGYDWAVLGDPVIELSPSTVDGD